jgi:5-methylcytosine-specific restriction endonuclease McrA
MSYSKEYYLANREKMRIATDLWISKNKERYLLAKRVNAKKNIRKNPCKKNMSNILRQALKISARPSWADNQIISDIYQESVYQQMVVDHIVPLRSSFVCGLHVEHNLQLLTKKDNLIKGNRLWPDM